MKNLHLLIVLTFCAQTLIAQTIWTNIGPGAGSDLHYLAIQPDNKNVIYTAGDIEGIFKTTDGGNTWENINNNLAQMPYGADIYWINEIKIDPVNYQKIFICDAVGLFVSNDGGSSWQLLYPEIIDDSNPPVSTSAIAIDAADTLRLFLGLGDEAGECAFSDFMPFSGYEGPWGVYRSLDGGQSWMFTGNGLPDSISVHTIDVIPNTDTVIMATNLGVFRSDDGGSSWTLKNTGLPHNNCHRIKVSDDYGYNILTLTLKTIGDVNDSTTFSGGIFRSDDMGNNWYDITGNLPRYDPYDNLFYDYWKFDIYPGDVDIIYIATNAEGSGFDETGIFATWDAGLDWELLYTPVQGGWLDNAFTWEGYAYDIRIAPSDPSRIVICRDNVEISNDTGYTWQNVFTTPVGSGWKGNGLELMNTESVAFDPSDSSKFYVGYDDFGWFRSDDAGNSFIRLDSIQGPVVGNVSDNDAVKEIFVDPANGDLYIERYQGSMGGLNEGFTLGGLLFSSDNGASVSDITGNLPKDGRYDVAVDFSSGSPGNRTIYAAIYHNGVYKSTDGGSTWNAINTGLSSNALFVWDIVINPGNSQELYLGINSWGQGNNGLYRSTDGGQNWSVISGLPTGDIGKVYFSNSQDVYVGISDDFDWSTMGGLYRSTDQGNNWNIIFNHTRIVDVEVNPSDPNVVIAIGQQWYNHTLSEDHGIFLSEDNGSTWNLITDQNINHTFFNFARFNPYNPKQVYAGTAGGGLWRTTLDIALSVANPKTLDNKINIFPNPSKDKTVIDLGKIVDKVEISVTNIWGQQILTSNFTNKQFLELNLNNINPGIYFIKIHSGSWDKVIKMIKY